jgi:hypothetical protein
MPQHLRRRLSAVLLHPHFTSVREFLIDAILEAMRSGSSLSLSRELCKPNYCSVSLFGLVWEEIFRGREKIKEVTG